MRVRESKSQKTRQLERCVLFDLRVLALGLNWIIIMKSKTVHICMDSVRFNRNMAARCK